MTKTNKWTDLVKKIGDWFWKSDTTKVTALVGLGIVGLNLLVSLFAYGFDGHLLLISFAWSWIIFGIMFLNEIPFIGIFFLIFGFPYASAVIGQAMGLTEGVLHFSVTIVTLVITTLYFIKDTVQFLEQLEFEKLRVTIWTKKPKT